MGHIESLCLQAQDKFHVILSVPNTFGLVVGAAAPLTTLFKKNFKLDSLFDGAIISPLCQTTVNLRFVACAGILRPKPMLVPTMASASNALRALRQSLNACPIIWSISASIGVARMPLVVVAAARRVMATSTARLQWSVRWNLIHPITIDLCTNYHPFRTKL